MGRRATWTRELVAQAERLWRDGLSYREIVQQIDPTGALGITRGAVAGQAYRLGWPKRSRDRR